jgi:hypothetical protein
MKNSQIFIHDLARFEESNFNDIAIIGQSGAGGGEDDHSKSKSTTVPLKNGNISAVTSIENTTRLDISSKHNSLTKTANTKPHRSLTNLTGSHPLPAVPQKKTNLFVSTTGSDDKAGNTSPKSTTSSTASSVSPSFISPTLTIQPNRRPSASASASAVVPNKSSSSSASASKQTSPGNLPVANYRSSTSSIATTTGPIASFSAPSDTVKRHDADPLLEEIIPIVKHESSKQTIRGQHVVRTPGIYVLCFGKMFFFILNMHV